MKKIRFLSLCLSMLLLFTFIPRMGIEAEVASGNEKGKYIYLELLGEANKNLKSDSAKFFAEFNLSDTTLAGVKEQSSELFNKLKNAIKEADLHSVELTLDSDNLYKYSDLRNDKVNGEAAMTSETETANSEDKSTEDKNTAGDKRSNETDNRIEVKYNRSMRIAFDVADTDELLSLSNIVINSAPSYVSEITYLKKDKSEAIAETRKLAIDNAKNKADFILKNLLKNYDPKNLKLVSIQENKGFNIGTPRDGAAGDTFEYAKMDSYKNAKQEMTGQDLHSDSLKLLFAYKMSDPEAEYNEKILNKFSKNDDAKNASALLWSDSKGEVSAKDGRSSLSGDGKYSTDDFASVLMLTLNSDNHAQMNEAQSAADKLRNDFLTNLKDNFADSCEILNEGFNTQSVVDYEKNKSVAYSVNLSYSLLIKKPEDIDKIAELASEYGLSSNSSPVPYSESINSGIAEALFSSIDSNLGKLGQMMDLNTFLTKSIFITESMSDASVHKNLSLEADDKWSLDIVSNSDLELLQ